jgi:hypothetical protein
MGKQVLSVVSILFILALTACSGTMKGVDRYSGERVYFAYENEKFGSAIIRVTMPDGERFTGKTLDKSTADEDSTLASRRYLTVDKFPGQIVAFLTGDRGTNMKCKFRLSDAVLGFKAGGYGLCQTSDDRLIDIFTR